MRNRSLAALVCSVVFISTFFGSFATAIGAQSGYLFPVHVILCDAFVEASNSASGQGIPPECRGAEGVRVSAYSTNSEPLDSCVTDADGFCALNIGPNGTRIFRQDLDSIPDGYTNLEPIKHTFTYTEFAEIWFHNYRDDVLPQRDAPRATVRVNTRVCPEKYAGDNFFEDCDGTLPAHAQWVFANDQVANAGKDGNAVLKNVPAAANSMIMSGYDLTTGDVFFYCSLTNDPEVRVPSSVEITAQYDGVTRDFVGVVELEPQLDVTCDWYQIPLLDRGLWDRVNNTLSGPESVDVPAPAGDITLNLKRCPKGFIPETITGAEKNCTSPENGATVRATSGDGTELATATTSPEGSALLSLSNQPLASFYITLDGHADAVPDLVACFSNVSTFEESGASIQQWATFDGADGWTMDGFGDDAQGYTCTWYLVPTGS